MTRYDFILLKGESEGFLSKLQELGVMDIKRSVKAIDETSASMLAEADVLRRRMAFLEAEDFAKDDEYADILESTVLLQKELELLEPWGEFEPDALTRLSDSGCKLHFHEVSKSKFDPSWAEVIPLQVISENGGNIYFVTAVPADEEYSFPVPEVDAPKASACDTRGKLDILKRKLNARRDELLAEKADMDKLRARYDAKLAEADFYFANAATGSAAEDRLTLVTGFAPSDNADLLRKEFDEMDIFYVTEDATVGDNPPIKLKNNKFVSMFEILTDMYGRPRYDGFDPTPYISIFFMLFFAMCMGDAGYGLVLILVGFLLKKVKSFADLSPLVVVLGAATTVIGVIFHTFFSIDITQWGWVKNSGMDCVMLPAKIAGYDASMIVAIVVGIVHLSVAMIVRTVYATRNKGFLNSLATWGWTLFLVGTVAVIAAVIAFNLDTALIKWTIIGLGSISAVGIFLLNDIHRSPLVNFGAGLWDTYNMATGILGDVLSYLRLYALGLAGAMLGFAFNTLANMALGDGGFGWIPFVLIALIGHVLNIAMAALGAFVHPLRLNFLEFFKNSEYDGSGRNYNPLKK
ncbi:MAG: hypothetical protein HUJ94_00340 [Bacteroidales bacterium]|nr:hypothetical protein [Bacteroidales bacterium]